MSRSSGTVSKMATEGLNSPDFAIFTGWASTRWTTFSFRKPLLLQVNLAGEPPHRTAHPQEVHPIGVTARENGGASGDDAWPGPAIQGHHLGGQDIGGREGQGETTGDAAEHGGSGLIARTRRLHAGGLEAAAGRPVGGIG